MYLFRLCKSTAKYSFLIKKFVLLKFLILNLVSFTYFVFLVLTINYYQNIIFQMIELKAFKF